MENISFNSLNLEDAWAFCGELESEKADGTALDNLAWNIFLVAVINIGTMIKRKRLGTERNQHVILIV